MLNVLPTHVVFNKAEPLKISGQSYFLSVHLVEEIDFFFPKPADASSLSVSCANVAANRAAP